MAEHFYVDLVMFCCLEQPAFSGITWVYLAPPALPIFSVHLFLLCEIVHWQKIKL